MIQIKNLQFLSDKALGRLTRSLFSISGRACEKVLFYLHKDWFVLLCGLDFLKILEFAHKKE